MRDEYDFTRGVRGKYFEECMASNARAAIATQFENSPPVLIEVRFPQMGTSPDWYLCEDDEQFEQLLERLAPGVEVLASSVWDLRNARGEICLTK